MSFIQRAKSTPVTAVMVTPFAKKIASRLVYLNETGTSWVGYDEAGLWPLAKARTMLGKVDQDEAEQPISFLSPDPSGEFCVVSFK